MDTIPDLVSQFVTRADAYCAQRGVSRTWLSKKLFADTYRIQNMADRRTDIGFDRLTKAFEDLTSLEAEGRIGSPEAQASLAQADPPDNRVASE